MIACLEYLPVVGPVFKATRAIRDAINEYTVINTKIWLNLYTFGQIDISANIPIEEENYKISLKNTSTLGIGAELGVSFSANLPKISFNTPPKLNDKFDISVEASAKGETSINFEASTGIDDDGIYIDLNMGFDGMIVYITGKINVWKMGITNNKSYELLEPKPNILQNKLYIIKNGKE